MVEENNWNNEFEEYIKDGEKNKLEKTMAWETAIGLQDVDKLRPSKYLVDTAKEHIEGNIDLKEVKKRINKYYEVLDRRKNVENDCEEADKVSVRIAEILSENTFNFSPSELFNIHKRLFDGIFKEAGKIREYNFTKKEWVLNNDTVIYSSYETIKSSLDYDFDQERNFSYNNLSLGDSIKHLCRFTSNIWQIHPFCEGNTRTTAVFIIKYLKTFGFNLNDDVFAKNSWYFRNSLVRANYKNFEKNVFEDISYLEKFFYNLLTDSNFELKNRYTHIDYKQSDSSDIDRSRNYTLEEQAILNLIKDNPRIKQEEISTSVNKSIRTIKTIMNQMQDKGLIERKNSKKNGEWNIL